MYSNSSIQWTETSGSSLSAISGGMSHAEARASMREKIYANETSRRVPSNFYREHTKAILGCLSNFSVIADDGTVNSDIPTFYATPERAIAKLKEDRNIILPVISLGIADIEEDLARRRYSQKLVSSSRWSETEQRAKRVIAKSSKAVNVTYTVSIWAKYVEDMNQLTEQISLLFNPDLVLTTKFGNQTKGFITDISDASDYSPGDREDRLVRKTISLIFETYLPTPSYLVTKTGEIETLGLDVEIN